MSYDIVTIPREFEIDRKKERLGRGLTNEDLSQLIDDVTRRRNAIERLAKSQREEIEALVGTLGKHAQRTPASPTHLRYIA
jgi:cell division septum initiation protein DivIVA